MATYGMALILPGINSYEVTEVYTGALTSSPGLAAAWNLPVNTLPN